MLQNKVKKEPVEGDKNVDEETALLMHEVDQRVENLCSDPLWKYSAINQEI